MMFFIIMPACVYVVCHQCVCLNDGQTGSVEPGPQELFKMCLDIKDQSDARRFILDGVKFAKNPDSSRQWKEGLERLREKHGFDFEYDPDDALP